MGWGRLVVGPYLPHLPSLSRYPRPRLPFTQALLAEGPAHMLTAQGKVPGGQRPLSLSIVNIFRSFLLICA